MHDSTDSRETKVLVVDDSALFRRFIYKSLEEIEGVEVVTFATNGRTALDKAKEYAPDVVTLDVEMPVMDGMETLEKLKALPKPPRVIMLSGQSGKGADITIRALELGADDFVLKPEGKSTGELIREMSTTLRSKIAGFRQDHGSTSFSKGGTGTTQQPPTPRQDRDSTGGSDRGATPSTGLLGRSSPTDGKGPRTPSAPGTGSLSRDRGHETRPAPRATTTGARRPGTPTREIPGPMPALDLRSKFKRIEAVVIGVSTGGPQALAKLLPKLSASFPIPIALVQHMPPKFTASLAQSLDRKCALNVSEANDGDRMAKGQILIAPGGRHMKLTKDGFGVNVMLTDDPPEQACRPAVNHLFWSAAEIYGGNVLAVILTGMGEDGLEGGRELLKRGAQLIAQDRPSCTVWGMPKRVAEEGVACATYPLGDLAALLTEVCKR